MTPTEPHRFGDEDASAARKLATNEGLTVREHPALERHYRIGDLADIWKLGRETVRLLVKDEPGVIKIRLGRKRAHTIYSIPESVAVRIHTRLMNSR